LNTNWP